jgi:HK97 family phage major capsid protein
MTVQTSTNAAPNAKEQTVAPQVGGFQTRHVTGDQITKRSSQSPQGKTLFASQLAAIFPDFRKNTPPPMAENAVAEAGRNSLWPLHRRGGGGENLMPEVLQQQFVTLLRDHNFFQRLNVPLDLQLEGKVAFAVQGTNPPPVELLDPDAANQPAAANDIHTKVYYNCILSTSVRFPKHMVRSFTERVAGYVEQHLLNAGGALLEESCLVGDGTDGNILGLLPTIEAAGSPSTVVSFGGSITTTKIADMVEALANQKAGLQPAACGFVVSPATYKSLLGLSDLSGNLPLVQSLNVMEKLRPYLFSLPLEVSPHMPDGQVLLGNFANACRLLYWVPSLDVIVNPYTETGSSEVIMRQYVNLAILRPNLLVLGK